MAKISCCVDSLCVLSHMNNCECSNELCVMKCWCSSYRCGLLGAEKLLKLVLMEEDLSVLIIEKPCRTANTCINLHKQTKFSSFQKLLGHGRTKVL